MNMRKETAGNVRLGDQENGISGYMLLDVLTTLCACVTDTPIACQKHFKPATRASLQDAFQKALGAREAASATSETHDAITGLGVQDVPDIALPATLQTGTTVTSEKPDEEATIQETPKKRQETPKKRQETPKKRQKNCSAAAELEKSAMQKSKETILEQRHRSGQSPSNMDIDLDGATNSPGPSVRQTQDSQSWLNSWDGHVLSPSARYPDTSSQVGRAYQTLYGGSYGWQDYNHAPYQQAQPHRTCHECCNTIQVLQRQVSDLQKDVAVLQQKDHATSTSQPSSQTSTSQPSTSQPVYNGHTKDSLKKAITGSKNCSDAVNTLLQKLFTIEELTTSSIMGVQNLKGAKKPALDCRKRATVEEIILEKYGLHSTSVRNMMRDRLKTMRQKYLPV